MAPKAHAKLPEGATEVAAPEGLPKGWIAVEKKYLTGVYAGQFYIRYQTIDGRHKSTGSVKKAVMLQAAEEGRDPEHAGREFQAWQEMEKARKKAESEQAKVDNVANRENAIEKFREKHGLLDGKMVQAFPGWKYEFTYSNNSGQTHVTYWDAEGNKWTLLKDIEAMLGNRMMEGIDITDLVQAGAEGAISFGAGEDRKTAKEMYFEKVAAGEDPDAERERIKREKRELKASSGKRHGREKRRKLLMSTDSEVEDIEVTDLEPIDWALHPGYKLVSCRRGSAWAVLPDDVTSVDLDVVGGRIEAAGWTRLGRTEVRHDFVCDFQVNSLSTALCSLSLLARGGLVVKWRDRAFVECVACHFVDKWLMDEDVSDEE